MAIDTAIGSEGNLLEPTPASARQIKLPTPILSNEELEKLAQPRRRRRRAGLQDRSRCRSSSRHAPAAPGCERGIEELRAAAPRDRRREQHHHPVRPRASTATGADPGAAGGGGGAPPPDARGAAHARRPGARDRRAARGASLRAADRLRRRRRQPLPGLRDARRHDPPDGPPAGRRREGREELRQGRRQGRHQGDVQDGHLDHPELPRRPGLRGRRPRPGRHRRVLHLDRLAHRRHRPRRRSPRKSLSATPTPSRIARCMATALDAGGQYSGAATASFTSSTRRRIHKLQHACRTGNYQGLQGVREADRRSVAEPLHAARPVRLQVDRTAGAARGGRVGRGDRQAVQDRAPCRTARSARRRTRRWRSP